VGDEKEKEKERGKGGKDGTRARQKIRREMIAQVAREDPSPGQEHNRRRGRKGKGKGKRGERRAGIMRRNR